MFAGIVEKAKAFLRKAQLGVMNLINAAIYLMIGLIIFGNVFAALNFAVFSTAVQALINIIPLVIVGLSVLALLSYALRG